MLYGIKIDKQCFKFKSNKIMKKLKLSLVLIAVLGLSITACKSENSSPETNPEIPADTINVENTAENNPEAQALKAKLDQAEIDLKNAMESGDKAAQEAALQARDEAQSAWDALKNAANESGNAIEDGAKSTVEGVKDAANEVGEASKEAYQGTKDGLKDAGKEVKETSQKVANDVKEGSKKLVDDVKNIGK